MAGYVPSSRASLLPCCFPVASLSPRSALDSRHGWATPIPKDRDVRGPLAAPEEFITELIDGELFMSPRPKVRHAIASSAIGGELGHAFG